MRLFEFVPIYDQIVDDDSLIEKLFGPEFCVIDETGQLLSTAHNHNLLLHAVRLLDQRDALERHNVAESLRTLRDSAEIVTQREYDLAVKREMGYSDQDFYGDYALKAGSLT
jgi:hypothetical protein